MTILCIMYTIKGNSKGGVEFRDFKAQDALSFSSSKIPSEPFGEIINKALYFQGFSTPMG